MDGKILDGMDAFARMFREQQETLDSLQKRINIMQCNYSSALGKLSERIVVLEDEVASLKRNGSGEILESDYVNWYVRDSISPELEVTTGVWDAAAKATLDYDNVSIVTIDDRRTGSSFPDEYTLDEYPIGP